MEGWLSEERAATSAQCVPYSKNSLNNLNEGIN